MEHLPVGSTLGSVHSWVYRGEYRIEAKARATPD